MWTWALLVIDWITSHMTDVITGAFTSIGSLIASPLGWLIIFGLAVSFLFYVKKMVGVKNAK